MSAGSRVWPAGGAAAGQMLEIFGHNVGVALSIPVGLFEIAFGVRLIAKGSRAKPRPRTGLACPHVTTAWARTASSNGAPRPAGAISDRRLSASASHRRPPGPGISATGQQRHGAEPTGLSSSRPPRLRPLPHPWPLLPPPRRSPLVTTATTMGTPTANGTTASRLEQPGDHYCAAPDETADARPLLPPLPVRAGQVAAGGHGDGAAHADSKRHPLIARPEQHGNRHHRAEPDETADARVLLPLLLTIDAGHHAVQLPGQAAQRRALGRRAAARARAGRAACRQAVVPRPDVSARGSMSSSGSPPSPRAPGAGEADAYPAADRLLRQFQPNISLAGSRSSACTTSCT